MRIGFSTIGQISAEQVAELRSERRPASGPEGTSRSSRAQATRPRSIRGRSTRSDSTSVIRPSRSSASRMTSAVSRYRCARSARRAAAASACRSRLGDVPRDGWTTLVTRPVDVRHRRDHERDVDDRSILPHPLRLEGPHRRLPARPLSMIDMSSALVSGRHEERAAPTDHFARRVPVQPFGARVPGEDGVIQGHAEDGVVRRVDDGGQTGAGLVRLLARRDVAQHAGEDRGLLRADGRDRQLHRKFRAVRSHRR